MRDLPVGIQQRVEILKALYRKARVLILDEPTAVLTPQEATDLFRVMRTLVADKRTSIVFITHKLHEVFQVADRIVVLRQGRVVGTLGAARRDRRIAGGDDGRPAGAAARRQRARPSRATSCCGPRPARCCPIAACWRSTSCRSRCARARFVGIAGVQGNGQTELVEALSGLRTPARRDRSSCSGAT